MTMSRVGSTHMGGTRPEGAERFRARQMPEIRGDHALAADEEAEPEIGGERGPALHLAGEVPLGVDHRSRVDPGRERDHGRRQHARVAAPSPAPECVRKCVDVVQCRDEAGGGHFVVERGVHDVLCRRDQRVRIEQPGAAIGAAGDDAAGSEIRTHAEARVRHAERRANVARHDIAEAKPVSVQSPDTLRRHRVGHDLRIARLLSRHRNCGRVADGGNHRLEIALPVCGDGRKAGRHAGRVAEKLPERRARLSFHAELGNHFADRRVQSRLAALDALQQGNGGQRLRNREYREDAVVAERRPGGAIGVAGRFVERDLAADGNDRRGSVIEAGPDVGFDRPLQPACHSRPSRSKTMATDEKRWASSPERYWMLLAR